MKFSLIIILTHGLVTMLLPTRKDASLWQETEQREGYSVSLIRYPIEDHTYAEAYLLSPDPDPRHCQHGRKHPALILLHDHGARFDIGKEKLVTPLAGEPELLRRSSREWMDRNFDGRAFGDSLAKAGYVVIVPDMLYWGSRSSGAARRWARVRFGEEEGDLRALKQQVYEGQRQVYDSLSRLGIVWAEKCLQDDQRALDWLLRLRSVDKRRVGVFGWSMGAHRAWLLAAADKRIRTGVALSWMSLKALQEQPYHASEYAMLIPALREHYDFPDIARALAPRPFLFLSGTEDKLFPAEAVAVAYARMREIYQAHACQEQLATEWYDGPHHCGVSVQRRIIQWFTQRLPKN